MQVGIDVTCMNTSFGGRDPSSFGDMATFQKRPNFPFRAWTIVHGHGKIQSIEIGSKNLCKYGLMYNTCTSILVGVVSPVLEILAHFIGFCISLLLIFLGVIMGEISNE